MHPHDTSGLLADSDAWGTGADALAGATLLDVRRAAVFSQAGALIPGAQWRDPAEVEAWAADVPRGRRVIVYYVHGHEVSRNTALALRAAGVDAWFLRGGIEGWKAQGLPLQARHAPPA